MIPAAARADFHRRTNKTRRGPGPPSLHLIPRHPEQFGDLRSPNQRWAACRGRGYDGSGLGAVDGLAPNVGGYQELKALVRAVSQGAHVGIPRRDHSPGREVGRKP